MFVVCFFLSYISVNEVLRVPFEVAIKHQAFTKTPNEMDGFFGFLVERLLVTTSNFRMLHGAGFMAILLFSSTPFFRSGRQSARLGCLWRDFGKPGGTSCVAATPLSGAVKLIGC